MRINNYRSFKLFRWLFAIAVVGLAAAIRSFIGPELGLRIQSALFITAVVASATVSGIRPAILSSILSVLCVIWLFSDPAHSFLIANPYDALSLPLFILVSMLIVGLAERVRRAERTALIAGMESEERYRLFVKASTQVVWTTGPQGRVEVDIPAWREYTGQSTEECLGYGWMNAIREEDRPRVSEAWKKAFESKSIYEVEYQLKLKDGTYRDILARGVPVLNPDGSIREWIGTCIDITPRKQAERDLLEKEVLFRSLADNISQLAWMADGNGEVFWHNKRWFEFTGTTLDEVKGWGWTKCHHPDYLPKTIERLKHSFETGEPWEDTFPIRGADGNYRWFLSRALPIQDDNGHIIRWLGTNTDITEHRLAELRLRESEERLSTVTQNARVGLVVLDSERRYAFANEAYAALLGLSTNEIIGKRVSDLLSDVYDSQIRPRLDRALAGESLTYELELSGKRFFAITYQPKESPVFGHCVVVVVADITMLKRLEEDLKAATVAAEQANAAKDNFLAVLSHELRTPLTPVLAAISLMRRRPDLPKDLLETIEIIKRNISVESRLIDDLLDLTRIVRGKISLEQVAVRLSDLLEQVAQVCKSDLEARNLHFKIDVKPGSDVVWGDTSRLQQIFWNLIKNSIKFTPEGGCIGITGRQKGSNYEVEITDSGIGIEPEVLPRIFNAFEQGDQRITREFGGLGLGLAITKKLVDLHHGSIEARSKGKGHGTTFAVRLPLYFGTSAGVVADKPEHDSPEDARNGKAPRVLLVEDHEDTAQMMRALLEGFGCRVEIAGDVSQAISASRADGFDLLISDLGLPDESGLDLMKRLREEGRSIKGIALSGFGREEDIRKSKEAGFVEHVTKPIDLEVLEQVVRRVGDM